MDILGLIHKKRSGKELSPGEIHGWVSAVVDDSAPDYQSAALLMAICYEGLNFEETLELTRAFVNSGETLSWKGFDKPVVDKHSTGGVGDSVSLLLLPWLAAEGFIVPKMSGRGLGHTGGTIDKLESIPGFRTDLSTEEMRKVLEDVGCCIISQTANLVPADKKLYSLRDATGTVDELGLIAASVVSKKIAAGAQYIVLDVKCGNGAFFKTHESAKAFAEVAIRLGKEFGRKIGCVITDMNQPLGMAIGNANEVSQAYGALEAWTFHSQSRLVVVAHALRNVLLVLSGKCNSIQEAEERPLPGKLGQFFERWISAQGGDLEKASELHQAHAQAMWTGTSSGPYKLIGIAAKSDAYLHEVNTLGLGELVRSFGAGRYKQDDVIDPLVGIQLQLGIGGRVQAEDKFGFIIAKKSDQRTDKELLKEMLTLFTFKPEPCDPIDPILEVVL